MEDQAEDRKWHANKANYYFPKIDRYPDLKTATLVFVASSLGLIILISALIILLYRMGARARQQRELQSRLQTISELLGRKTRQEARAQPITRGHFSPITFDSFRHCRRRADRRNFCNGRSPGIRGATGLRRSGEARIRLGDDWPKEAKDVPRQKLSFKPPRFFVSFDSCIIIFFARIVHCWKSRGILQEQEGILPPLQTFC